MIGAVPTLRDELRRPLPADVITALRRGAIAARALDVQTRPRPASPDFAARFPFYMTADAARALLLRSLWRRLAVMLLRQDGTGCQRLLARIDHLKKGPAQ